MEEVVQDQPPPQACEGQDIWAVLIEEYGGVYPDLVKDMHWPGERGECIGGDIEKAVQTLLKSAYHIRSEMEKTDRSDHVLQSALWDTLRTAQTLRWRMAYSGGTPS